MSKRAIRGCRTVLVGALVVFMTFESALACRWRSRRSGYGAPSCSADVAVASQSPIQKGAAPILDEPPAVPTPPQTAEVGPAVIVEPVTPRAEESASDKPAPPPDPAPPETPQPEPAPIEPAKADPPSVEPAKIEPAEPTAKPAKPDDFDDLFPPPSPKPPVPVDPPADAPPADPPPPTPPAEVKPAVPAPSPTEDDPFAPAPAATPAPPKPATPAPATPKPPAVDDDPFAPAPATPPSAPKPATPATPAVDDDPFKISAEGTLAVREWVDDSGSFRIRGRLIAVLDGKVRILKETGRTTTVALERLSRADREYVKELATRYGEELDSRLASR